MMGGLSVVEKQRLSHDLIYEVLYWIDSLVLVIDTEGYIIVFNRASERLSGYRLEELQYRPFWDLLILPEERNAVKNTIRDVTEKGLPNEFRNHWRTKDGRKRLIHWKNSILRRTDGSVAHLLCTGRDITEQVAAERDLRASNAEYKELVQNANSIILRMDTEGRVTFLNDFAEHFFGYQEEEILGRSVLGTILPETDSLGNDLSGFIAALTRVPDDYVNSENENMRRNGERAWVAWTNRAIRDDAGQVIGILSIGNDITQRKLLERQLQNVQRTEALGTLAGGVAHDLNNILSPIIGFTELVLSDLDPRSEAAENLQNVLEAGNRARKLVKQILTYSRQHDQENNPTQFSTVVREALRLVRASCPAIIDIQSEIRSAAYVLGDPTQLHQVIVNLCTNAIQSMAATGGTLEVNLREANLTDQSGIALPKFKPGLYVELQIRDNGPGMPDQVVKRVFDPFFTTKGDGQGSGLGLSVAQGIIHNHSGGMTVDSSAGTGTTFLIYLPVIERPRQPAVAADKVLPTGNEHILFVDDEQAITHFCRQMLQGLGYRVSIYTDEEEALEQFRSNPRQFDLVITDLAMPHISGDDLARLIWQIRPGMPVVLCTGFGLTLDRESALAMGFSAYVTKPILRGALARTVRRVLDGISSSAE